MKVVVVWAEAIESYWESLKSGILSDLSAPDKKG